MKKWMKYIALLLIAALLYTALPLTAAQAARPKTFDKSRIKCAKAQIPAELYIEDMTFRGVLKPSLDDEELDKLIEETMKELGLTEEAFNRASDNHDDYKAREEYMSKRLTESVAEQVTLDPSASTKIIQLLFQGDFQGAFSVLWNATVGSNTASKSFDSQRLQVELLKFWKEISVEVSKLDKFYDELNEKIFQKKIGCTLEFKDAKAEKKTFSLFGTENTELWTLNMTLKRHLDDSKEYVFGLQNIMTEYNGSYSIDIEYDLSDFENNLEPAIRLHMGSLTKAIDDVIEAGWGQHIWFTVTPAPCRVSRRLSGDAEAMVSLILISARGQRIDIIPTQTGDQKDVSVADIKINAAWRTSFGDISMEFTWDVDLTADDKAFIAFTKDGQGAVTDTAGTHQMTRSEHSLTIPWEGIWDRGDKAGQGWKLRVW